MLVWDVRLLLLVVLLELLLLMDPVVVGSFLLSVPGIDLVDPLSCVSVDIPAHSESNDQSCNIGNPFQGAVLALDLRVRQVVDVVSNVDRQEESRRGKDGGHDELPIGNMGHGTKDRVQDWQQ